MEYEFWSVYPYYCVARFTLMSAKTINSTDLNIITYMRTLVLSLLLLSVFAANMTFYHYKNGQLFKTGRNGTRIQGPLFIEKYRNGYNVILAGIYNEKQKNVSFALLGQATTTLHSNGSRSYSGICYGVSWAHKEYNTHGNFTIHQYKNATSYFANCTTYDGRVNYLANTTVVKSKCPFYTSNESASRAVDLLGMSNRMYNPVHVVNHAVLGYAYIPNIMNCTWYLHNLNKTMNKTKPGLVIVGKDGGHCGVVDLSAKRFIHSDQHKRKIIETAMGMAKQYFKKGYILKDHSC